MSPLIIANWKMNPRDSKEALDLAVSITKGLEGVEAQVVLCPPFVYIPELQPKNNIFLGAQDCFWEDQGAFTGEVSPLMLRNAGCTYVIVGHSERSQFLKETPEMVKQKIHSAMSVGLAVVVCVSQESLEERQTELEVKLLSLLKGIKPSDLSKLVLAYEPLWAISTNKGSKAESPDDLEAAVAHIRGTLDSLFGEAALQISILYGGSVTADNVTTFLGLEKAQGVLVGAASLDAQEFVALVKNAAAGYKE